MELISRERLIDEVVAIAKTSESDWRGVKFSAREIKFLIELQKPVESRPKGKWETVSREKEACEIFFANKKCSRCGYEYCFPFNYKYCPECGADMRGEK